MQRISSNLTLILKIFLPTVWVVFFGLFTLAVWATGVFSFGGVSGAGFKLGLTAFFLAGTALLYFTFWQLKRVELDESYVYVSNYFKTYRYPYHSIERIAERDATLFHLVTIHLKAPGHFGKKITFLLDEPMWKDFLDKHPGVTGKFGLKS